MQFLFQILKASSHFCRTAPATCRNIQFSDTNISQRSATTHFRCGKIFNDPLLQISWSVTVKDVWFENRSKFIEAQVSFSGGIKSDTIFNYVNIMPYKPQNTKFLYRLKNVYARQLYRQVLLSAY